MRTLNLKHWVLCALCVIAVGLSAEDAPKPATPTPPPGGGGGGGGFGRQQWTPEQIAKARQDRMDRLKGELGSTDDEFKALQPKIEAVQKAQGAVRAGSFGGFGRRPGGGGGPTGNADDQPETQKKLAALRTLMENKDADPKAIAEALKALREERTKAKDALKKAQDELKELVTAKQEAVFVINGTLE